MNALGAAWGGALILLAVSAGGVERGLAAAPPDFMEQGRAAYEAGNLTRAWTAFRQAAALARDSARPALWLGAVAVARGDRGGAAAWFEAARLRHPSLPEESCAVQWLRLLGLAAQRPRWHLQSAADYAAFVGAVNPRLTPQGARWLGTAVIVAATHARIDPRLLAAVVFTESRFNPGSVSSAGAEGLGQLMPGTAAGLGVDPRDPLQNLEGAAVLLRLDLGEFTTMPLALAAYNAGSGAVRRWGGVPPYAETQWYVWAVLWVYDGLQG